MARNEALLREIGLTGVTTPKARPKTTPKRKTLTPRRREASEPVVRRTSSRLSGIPADSEVAKRKAEVENEARLEQERQKRKRVAGPIQVFEASDVDATFSNWEELSKINKARAETSRDVKQEHSKFEDLPELRSQFGSMSLFSRWEPNRIKITPERIFSMAMHPSTTKKLGLAGDKLGYVGMWDIEGMRVKVEDDADEVPEEEEEPLIHQFKIHTRTITSFSFHPNDSSKLYSSSYDGSIRCLDFNTGIAVEIFGSATDQAITALQTPPDGHSIYFSTLEGEMGVRDIRTKQSECSFYQLHDRKIGSFGMHPRESHILATASLDRTLKIWDFRKVGGTRSSHQPALRGEYLCNLSVSSAYINSNGMVLATSFDDTLKIFDISDNSKWPQGSTKEMEPATQIRHNNQTGRWITVFKAAWQSDPADGIQKFAVGDMKRKVNVFDGTGQLLGDLQDEMITAIPAVVAFHPSQNWILAGNGSGKALYFE